MEKLASLIIVILITMYSPCSKANADRAMDLYLDQNYEEAFKLFQKTAHLFYFIF